MVDTFLFGLGFLVVLGTYTMVALECAHQQRTRVSRVSSRHCVWPVILELRMEQQRAPAGRSGGR